ncbi:MAG: hypothetical protein Q8S84_06445 [bacterium]|nr:hypothetical protein [bacterium]
MSLCILISDCSNSEFNNLLAIDNSLSVKVLDLTSTILFHI